MIVDYDQHVLYGAREYQLLPVTAVHISKW